MKNAWTWIEPVAQDIEQIREDLRSFVPDDWMEETDPHLSVLPGFEVPEDAADDVLTACAEASEGLVGEEIEVTGFHCFNPLDADDETFVIGLDVEVDLEATREVQESVIEAAGGELLYEPVPAHITLYKEGDGGDENDGLTDVENAVLKARLTELAEQAEFEATVGAAPAETF